MPSSCPSNEVFQAVLADRLPEGELASLAQHLETCAVCRERLEELAGGIGWLPTRQRPAEAPRLHASLRMRAAMDSLRSLLDPTGEASSTHADPARLDFLSPATQSGCLGRLGSYEVLEEIDRGGMGIVLKARDPVLDRVVAIKVLAPALAANPAARARFLREARAAAAVSHEHVVDIHAVEEANGLPYLVMRFISGQSLRERIRQTGPLALPEILRIGSQIASGLAAAHAQGLIHRDIKPANILLENSVERVKITDFGLATVVGDTSTTQTGHLAGTPEFMAPEQARGEAVDHRADLFSLGCVLYCMAVGKSPFEGPSILSVIRKLCEEEARPVREANPALPGWFGEIVSQLLAKDPAQRPQSAREVAQMLEAQLARIQRAELPPGPVGEPELNGAAQTAQRPLPRQWTRRRRIVAGAIGAVMLVVLGWLLVSLLTPPSETMAVGVFQVVGTNGQATGVFPSLSEAVRSAQSGDTIEVTADGPFELEPVALGKKALAIRAGPGTQPVFVTRREAEPRLTTEAFLVLEGLEFQEEEDPDLSPGQAPRRRLSSVVSSRGAPLFVANCRFRIPAQARFQTECGVLVTDSPHAEIRNCAFYANARAGCGVAWVADAAPPGWDATNVEMRLWMENCLQLSVVALSLSHQAPARASIRLLRNSFSTQILLVLPTLAVQSGLSVFAGTNVFDTHTFFKQGKRLGAADLKDILNWQDSHNLFVVARTFSDPASGPEEPRLRDLAEWNRYWNQTNTGSGQVQLGLGAALKKVRLDALSPGHFQLTPADYDRIEAAGGDRSVAYGAAVERVGPGLAYHMWRRSPEYRQWQERIRRFCPQSNR